MSNTPTFTKLTGLILSTFLLIHTPMLVANPFPNHLTSSILSKEEVRKIVKSQTPAKILKIKRKGQNYRVKLLTKKGHVRHILIDASSGDIVPKQ